MKTAMYTRWTTCLVLLFAMQLACAEQSVRPGINRHYENPDWDRWVGVFESPRREVYALRHAVIDASRVREGMDVADIGAGTGFYTRLFAERVGPAGRVYAVDISRNFVDNILRESRAAGQRNIVGIVNRDTDTGLAPASIDLAFLCDTYHHFEYPASMLASIHRALRPGGRVIIIDFIRDPEKSSDWVMGHVRAGKRTVIEEVTRAGFEYAGERTMLRHNYFLEFRK